MQEEGIPQGVHEPRGGPGVSPSMAEAFRRLSDALARLLREHIALAKAELADDLKRAGRDIAIAAAGVPFMLLSIVLLSAALALFLGRWLTPAGGFLAVGLLYLLIGVLLTALFGRRLATKDAPDLDRTAGVLREDSRWLKQFRRS